LLNLLAIFAGDVPVFFLIVVIKRKFFPEIAPYMAKSKLKREAENQRD